MGFEGQLSKTSSPQSLHDEYGYLSNHGIALDASSAKTAICFGGVSAHTVVSTLCTSAIFTSTRTKGALPPAQAPTRTL